MTYEGIKEPGPMVRFAIERNYDEKRDSTVIFDISDYFWFARQQDATLAALTEALESHMVTERGEGRATVSHTANCGCWRTGDPDDCGHSCQLTRAALARAGRLPQ